MRKIRTIHFPPSAERPRPPEHQNRPKPPEQPQPEHLDHPKLKELKDFKVGDPII